MPGYRDEDKRKPRVSSCRRQKLSTHNRMNVLVCYIREGIDEYQTHVGPLQFVRLMPGPNKIIPVYQQQWHCQKGSTRLTHATKQIDIVQLLQFIRLESISLLIHGSKGKANVCRHDNGHGLDGIPQFGRILRIVFIRIVIIGFGIAPGAEQYTRHQEKERRPFGDPECVDAEQQRHRRSGDGITGLDGFDKVRRRLRKGVVGTQKVERIEATDQNKIGVRQPGKIPSQLVTLAPHGDGADDADAGRLLLLLVLR